MMYDAQQLRSKAMNINRDTSPNLIKIEISAAVAANKGEFSIGFDGVLSSNELVTLKHLGFHVEREYEYKRIEVPDYEDEISGLIYLDKYTINFGL